MRNNLSYTEIKVEDTGYGISKEDQTRIFDRYYQAKGTRQVPGTGIGLALVKNLADLHEGRDQG
jgi:signal transduction histidine kinase